MELILKNIAIIQSKNTIWIQATQLMAMAVLNSAKLCPETQK